MERPDVITVRITVRNVQVFRNKGYVKRYEDVTSYSPYTKSIFSAVPNSNPEKKSKRIIDKGDIPSQVNPPKGCKFCTRYPNCMEICKHIAPEYKEIEKGHIVACHLFDKK